MAESIVRIVINAVDKYSGVLTGLNQGIELVSKGFGLLNTAASAAAAGISKSLDVAAKGGEFQEISNQLQNVARAFNQPADEIVKSVQDISLNMLELPKAAKLAGRGITLGLDKDQIADVLTFVKRRTELTGESFEGLSETVFNAVASGRGKSLFASFGIAVKAGEGLDSIVGKLKDATKAYGQTGFNAADDLNRLSTAQADFTTKIGQAINAAPSFQKALSGVTAFVVEFVRSLDIQKIGAFVEVGIKSFFRLVESAASVFPGLSEFIRKTFESGAKFGESFADVAIDAFFDVLRYAAQTYNSILGIFQGLNFDNIFSSGIDGAVQLFLFFADAVARVMTTIADTVLDGFQNILAGVETLLRETPGLADILGISPEEVAVVDQRLEKVRRALQKAPEAVAGALESISTASEKVFSGDANKALDSWKVDLAAIDRAQQDVARTAKDIKFEPAQFSAIDPKTITGQLSGLQDDLDKAEKVASKKAIDITKAINKASTAPLEQFAEGELAKLTDRLFFLEDRLSKGKSVYFGEDERLRREAEEIRKKLQFKLSIVDDLKGGSFAQEVKQFLAGANWPAEFQALGEFLLTFVLAKARGESLPVAIVTQAGGI